MTIRTDTRNNKWFCEANSQFWPGQEFSIEIEEILYQQRSKYQDVLVFKSKTYGNVLVLDDCIQCTERDEFAYQEMAAFLPLLSHPDPKRVLIIGGGDGGVIREVVKHPQVEEVILCEIDEDVIDVSKKYLPNMAQEFANSKVTVIICDGCEYLKQHTNEFDVIITDSSDPDGPAKVLFEEPYYLLMKSALKQPYGIICCQGECIWLDLPLIKKLVRICSRLFQCVAYANVSTPTYPCGALGFLVCSLNENAKLTEPNNIKLANELNTKYYTADIHRACFALPAFVRKELEDMNK
ncbi:unnamed protein product [Rotaria magnacalcarata]|uniref:Spermidine synthase n=4 Tax=Rotaria magnacalcarata TaxID=392030 RepID=A0A814J376_9BILA|nr:unnamed protein product [Rotaria magnacalcarata]CAF3931292.1 unnamed protein product [Rotaria magnacalcarata]